MEKGGLGVNMWSMRLRLEGGRLKIHSWSNAGIKSRMKLTKVVTLVRQMEVDLSQPTWKRSCTWSHIFGGVGHCGERAFLYRTCTWGQVHWSKLHQAMGKSTKSV